MKIVRNDVRKWSAIDRNRRGVDDARCVICRPDSLEKGPGAVEIYAVAEIELGLCLAGNNAREMENDVGAAFDKGSRASGNRQVARVRRNCDVTSIWGIEWHHVVQVDGSNRAACNGAFFQ